MRANTDTLRNQTLAEEQALAASLPPEILTRRDALFRESMFETIQRTALGTAWSLMPRRIGQLAPLARVWLADFIDPLHDLPDPNRTFGEFAGVAHDISPPMLLAAYARGLYPKGHFGPLKWISPAERCVLLLDEYHMPKRLRRLMRQGKYSVTFDRDFEGVIKACAGKRDGRWHVTWITPRIMRAYAKLYDLGAAHSFEVWNKEGELVGGGYGVAVGGVFFTESQFSQESNTSKLGFSVLNWHLAKWGFHLNDGKRATPTILEMGFRMIPRSEFLDALRAHQAPVGPLGHWQIEAGPDIVADWQPAAAQQAAS